MTDDIVNQLRYPIVEDAHLTTELIACRHIMREAADEIERLRSYARACLQSLEHDEIAGPPPPPGANDKWIDGIYHGRSRS